MTKRVQLVEEPYNGIQVGEKVMYLATSYDRTRVQFGFYRGTSLMIPVVEYFYREKKWRWNKERNKFIEDNDWSICSRRAFLGKGRVFNCSSLQKIFDHLDTPRVARRTHRERYF